MQEILIMLFCCREKEGVGRLLVAARDIDKGELIFTEKVVYWDYYKQSFSIIQGTSNQSLAEYLDIFKYSGYCDIFFGYNSYSTDFPSLSHWLYREKAVLQISCQLAAN